MATIGAPQIKTKRVVGVTRVSEQGERLDENLHSPEVQARRIGELCDGPELELLTVLPPEIDVRGKAPINKRPSLRRAIEMIEAGQADILAVGYFDRLVRSLKVQQEIVDRVEAAGGEVWTVDFGQVSHRTAIQRLTGTLIGAVNEFVSEQIGEKAREGVKRAVEVAGRFPGPTPPGYRISVIGVDPKTGQTITGPLELAGADEVAAIVEAFNMRLEKPPRSHAAIRAYLAEHGINLSVSGVRAMLASRVYLGEVHHGSTHNLDAHPAIVDRDVFELVQQQRAQRRGERGGRNAKSDRLLARLDVLHCDECGGRMSVGVAVRQSPNGEWDEKLGKRVKRYPFYRCTSQKCARPQTIAAEPVERAVVAAVKEMLADVRERVEADLRYRHAVDMLEHAEQAQDNLIDLLSGFENKPAARRKLGKAEADIEHWRSEVDRLKPANATFEVTIDHWDKFTSAGQRAFIKAVIRDVRIRPVETGDRIVITPNT